MRKLAIVLVLLAACTKKADQCTSNSDCTDPAYPFCDVNGEFAPSGGATNVCTITPTDCPVAQCGCEVGSATCSSDGTLTVCNPDGMSVTTTMCATGCELPAATCKVIVASNGLGPALAASAGEPAITIPAGSTIDTDTGAVVDANSMTVAVTSTLVTQASAAPIRVFAGATVTVGDVTIVGTSPVAFVADGPVVVANIEASGSGSASGPGAVSSGVCVGGAELIDYADSPISGPGAGGGGNATVGASGGGHDLAGGSGGGVVEGFDVLAGGCSGGASTYEDSGADTVDSGGGGGGGVELVSNATVNIQGVINVGGGGGEQNSGGGAGGIVIVEAPTVELGATGGIAANGGAGGGACNGADATADSIPAPGGSAGSGCTTGTKVDMGGAGGTGSDLPVAGTLESQPTTPIVLHGGGGGSVGRARIVTLDGTFMSTSTTLLSVESMTDTLVLQ